MTVNTMTRRNLSAECLKLIASFCVVFIHVTFPGKAGSLVHYLSGFAVPTFFAITGFFNHGADCAAIQRRMKHILSLILIGTMIYLVWDCFRTELEGGSTIAYLRAWIPDPIEVVNFILFHLHPYANHLWYLNSLLFCYGLLWAVTRFFPEEKIPGKKLYPLGLGLGIVLLMFDVVTPAGSPEPASAVIAGSYHTSIPWFVLGLFLADNRERIFSRYGLTGKRLLLLLAVSLGFSVLQWSCTGIGKMTFGTPFTVLALVLLVISHPQVPRWLEGPAKHFGAISTWIYLDHLAIGMMYWYFLAEPLTALLGGAEPWLRPILVVAASFLAAMVMDRLSLLRRRLRKKA